MLAKELKMKFLEILDKYEHFSCEEGNPFLIKIGNKQFFIFLKNVSPAYFKHSPDVTRVQLPYSERFSKILKAEIPFVILGYDFDNDIMVCWNPNKIKERLNAKRNVSLYSRESLQSNVKPNEFQSGFLSNGEKIIIFRRTNLLLFFDNLNTLFSEICNNDNEIVSEPVVKMGANKILEITDKDLIDAINPLLKRNKVLEAVDVCLKYYEKEHKNMTFKDCFNLVNQLYQKYNEKR